MSCFGFKIYQIKTVVLLFWTKAQSLKDTLKPPPFPEPLHASSLSYFRCSGFLNISSYFEELFCHLSFENKILA